MYIFYDENLLIFELRNLGKMNAYMNILLLQNHDDEKNTLLLWCLW
jgi:hypothetical protein